MLDPKDGQLHIKYAIGEVRDLTVLGIIGVESQKIQPQRAHRSILSAKEMI